MVACADVLAGESVAPLLAVAALLLPRPALRKQPTAGACMVWFGPAAACAHMRAWPAARGGRANLVPPRKDELELERARVVRRERHEPLAPTISRRVGYQWLARDAGAEDRRRIQSLAARRHVRRVGMARRIPWLGAWVRKEG